MNKSIQNNRLKSRLKNAKAKIGRRDAKIKELEARLAMAEAEVKKKAHAKHTEQVRLNIMKSFPDTNSTNLQPNSPFQSDQLQELALEQLLKLLSD